MIVTQCNVAGLNHTNKLIENMFSEVKQQLAELKQEIKNKCVKGLCKKRNSFLACENLRILELFHLQFDLVARHQI